MIASSLVYQYWKPEKYTNYGELIRPTPISQAQLGLISGGTFSFAQLKGKWIFLALDNTDCSPVCVQKLYKMRQIRLTQGKEMSRIERVWVTSKNQSFLSEYPGMWVVKTDLSVAASLPAPSSPNGYIYLIDPLGNVMMRYPQNIEPKKVVKDITRLLKVSSVG